MALHSGHEPRPRPGTQVGAQDPAAQWRTAVDHGAARPDEDIERAERIQGVRRALEKLPDRDRQLLLMREEGFKYEEIAGVIGVAPALVGTLIARALRRFVEAYKANGAVDESHR